MASIRIKRAYVPASEEDGARFLVDRLWPRGRTKVELQATWTKDVAPSAALRDWYHAHPEDWNGFSARYEEELDAGEAWRPLVEAAREGPVTLVYASKDEKRNNAVALAQYLRRKLR